MRLILALLAILSAGFAAAAPPDEISADDWREMELAEAKVAAARSALELAELRQRILGDAVKAKYGLEDGKYGVDPKTRKIKRAPAEAPKKESKK